MKGYFVTEDQISNLKERLELDKLMGPYSGKQNLKKVISSVHISLQKKVIRQVEDWIKQISK